MQIPKILTTKDLGLVLKMTGNAVRIHMHRHPEDLPKGFKVGRNWRWKAEVVAEWLNSK